MIFQVALNLPPPTILPSVAVSSVYLACQVNGFCASLQCMCFYSGVGIAAAELPRKHHTDCGCGFSDMLRILCATTVMTSDNGGKGHTGLDD